MPTNIPAVVAGLALAAGLIFITTGVPGYGISALLFGIGMAVLAVAQEIRTFNKRNQP